MLTLLSTDRALEERRGKEQRTAKEAVYNLSCKGIYTLPQINPEVPFFPTLVLQRGLSLNEE